MDASNDMGAGQNPETPTQGAQSSTPTQQKNMVMGILAYLGILVIVPYLVAKDDPFVKFHIKQGLVLLVIEAIVWVLGMFMWQLIGLLSIVNLAVVILAIVGIVRVVQGKEEPLPLVGGFAESFQI